MEDYAIILDFLPLGYVKEGSNSYKRKPVAQAIGTEEFTLLELTPKENVNLDIHEKVYIGAGQRDKIARVNRRLPFNKMTSTAQIEVNYVLEEIVKRKEENSSDFSMKQAQFPPDYIKLSFYLELEKTHVGYYTST